MLESHVDESIHIMSCSNSEHIMSSPTAGTTVIDLSLTPNACKKTPPLVGLPLSSTLSSSQTKTTSTHTKSLSKQSRDDEMEENCKIVTEFDEATCIKSIATHVYVSKHAILQK